MRIVVKVGTSTLAHPTGRMNIRRVEALCPVRVIDYNHSQRVYDNSIFYRSFSTWSLDFQGTYNERGREDYEMFCKFWPRWISWLITRAYSTSENSNQV